MDAVLAQDAQPCLGIAGPELPVGADLDRGRHARAVGEIPGIVLHVDHQRVDFGAIGQGHQIAEAPPAEGPRIDVDRPHVCRRLLERRRGPAQREVERGRIDRHGGQGRCRRQLVIAALALLGRERCNNQRCKVQKNGQNTAGKRAGHETLS